MSSLRFLVDEDFDNDIVRGVLRRSPGLDLVRVQDVDLSGSEDPVILDWAARENRIVLSHDVSTMTKFAGDRVSQGLAMPGLFAVSQSLPIGKAIEEILILAECSVEGEWEGQVRYLPL